MIVYLDTNVAVWLAQGTLQRISRRALRALEQSTLLVSPMVLMELEYLYELNRITLPPRDLQRKLQHEIDVRVCDLPFFSVISAALDEKPRRTASRCWCLPMSKSGRTIHERRGETRAS